MAEYDNTNTGALFGNERKREGKKDPDLQGKLNIAGVEHWMSAWLFTYEKDGKKRRGINIRLGDRVDKQEQKPAAKGHFDDMDDDIPF